MILSPAERAQAYTYAADLVEDKQHTQFANLALRQFLGYFHTDMSLPLEHYFPELPKMDDPQVWRRGPCRGVPEGGSRNT
jgi:hypothetical protein